MNENILYEVNIPAHQDQLNDLLKTCYGSDQQSIGYFLGGMKSPNQIVSITAKADGVLVGAAVAWKMRFHPNSTYISVASNPLYQEIDASLLKMVEEYDALEYPLQTSLWETSHRCKGLYEQSGFQEIRKTNVSTLQISFVPPLETLITKYKLDAIRHSVKNLHEIKAHDEMKDQLVKLVKHTYQTTHTANPLGVHDHTVWEGLVFDEDTILKGSYAFVDENEVVAFALLHETGDDNRLEFGWRGMKKEMKEDLILLLTAYQIDFAKLQGYQNIDAEMDSTDPYSMVLLKYFPFSPSPTWITYQKRRLLK